MAESRAPLVELRNEQKHTVLHGILLLAPGELRDAHRLDHVVVIVFKALHFEHRPETPTAQAVQDLEVAHGRACARLGHLCWNMHRVA